MLRRALIWMFNNLGISRFHREFICPRINRVFFTTNTWMGKPNWQNILDLWTIQETIWEIKPEILIECGTNKGGSSFFYAQLFDLIGHGKVTTIDIEKMHDFQHPRVEYIIGNSLSDEVFGRVRSIVSEVTGAIMVILDSDHSRDHVRKELELYSLFVTSGSFILVQDGIIDVLPVFKIDRPGPLPAIKDFLSSHNDFVLDQERCERFIITHHISGWLRRKESSEI